jgi:glycosyltransferase 2 family protein
VNGGPAVRDLRRDEGERTATVRRPAAALARPAGWGRRIAALRAPLARMWPFLRIAAFVVAIAIVAVMARRAYHSVDLGALSLWALAASLPFTMVWWVLLARGWALLVTGESRRGDVSMWFRTQAVRYLPGGIWAPASRATLLPGSLSDKLATVGAENVIALCAALAVGGATFALDGQVWWLPLALVAAVPAIAARFVTNHSRVTAARAVRVLGNDGAAFVAYAVAAVLVQQAVSGRTDAFAVAAAAAIAWGAGLIVVVAPSGLGVREVVYVALLSDRFASGQATTAAVTLRGVTVVAELLFLVLLGRPRPEDARPPVDG